MNNLKVILFLLPLAFSAACGSNGTTHPDVEAPHEEHGAVQLSESQMQALEIEVGALPKMKIGMSVTVSGVLQVPPQNRVSVSLPFGAYVVSTPVLEGLRVKKGQILFVVQHPDLIALQQQYLEVSAAFDWAMSEHERLQLLLRDSAIDRRSAQIAENDFKSDRAGKLGIEAQLRMAGLDPDYITKNGIVEKIEITAPVTGYVGGVNTNVGAFADAGEVLCTLIDPGHLHVELQVLENDLPHVHPGDDINVWIMGEKSPRKASVYLIGKELNPDRTVTVHGHFEVEDTSLTAGVYVKAIISRPAALQHVFTADARVLNQGKLLGYRVEKQGEMYLLHPFDLTADNIDAQRPLPIPPGTDTTAHYVLSGAHRVKSVMFNSDDDGHGH